MPKNQTTPRHHNGRAPLEVQYGARAAAWLGKLGATIAVLAVLSINGPAPL